MLYRAGHSLKVADRPDAGVEIQQLPQRHIKAANSTADRSSERALDCNPEFLDRRQRVVGQPGAKFLKRLFPGEHFEPSDLAGPIRNFVDRCIKHQL